MFDHLLDLSHCDSASIILLSGLVSAFVSLTVHFVREITDYIRKDKESKKQLFENSIAPLINAFENLLWRLTEIIDNECLYFEDIANSNVYLDYKKKSTLYRLSVVFGQIYLLKHEKRFTALSRLYPDLKDRLQRFGSVLSDGSWLDKCNTKQICELLNIEFPKQIERISVRIENLVFETIRCSNKEQLRHLSDAQKTKFVSSLYDLFHSQKRSPNVDQNGVIRILSRKNVCILREMQDDIGHTMLRLDTKEKGSIIGYSEFCDKLQNQMFSRLKELFDGINFCTDKIDLDARYLIDEINLFTDKIDLDARYLVLLNLEKETKDVIAYLKNNPLYKHKDKKTKIKCTLWRGEKTKESDFSYHNYNGATTFREHILELYNKMYGL